jgi:hypothetical protein
VRVLDRAKMAMPSLVLAWVDVAYSRRVRDFAARALRIAVQVVAKMVGQQGFVPLSGAGSSSAHTPGSPATAG